MCSVCVWCHKSTFSYSAINIRVARIDILLYIPSMLWFCGGSAGEVVKLYPLLQRATVRKQR